MIPKFTVSIHNGKVMTADPHPHWVYVIRGLDGDVIYVGMTDSPMPRMQKHQKTGAWFQGLCGSVEFHEYADRYQALRAEWQMIRQLRPQMNVLGNGDTANVA